MKRSTSEKESEVARSQNDRGNDFKRRRIDDGKKGERELREKKASAAEAPARIGTVRGNSRTSTNDADKKAGEILASYSKPKTSRSAPANRSSLTNVFSTSFSNSKKIHSANREKAAFEETTRTTKVPSARTQKERRQMPKNSMLSKKFAHVMEDDVEDERFVRDGTFAKKGGSYTSNNDDDNDDDDDDKEDEEEREDEGEEGEEAREEKSSASSSSQSREEERSDISEAKEDVMINEDGDGEGSGTEKWNASEQTNENIIPAREGNRDFGRSSFGETTIKEDASSVAFASRKGSSKGPGGGGGGNFSKVVMRSFGRKGEGISPDGVSSSSSEEDDEEKRGGRGGAGKAMATEGRQIDGGCVRFVNTAVQSRLVEGAKKAFSDSRHYSAITNLMRVRRGTLCTDVTADPLSNVNYVDPAKRDQSYGRRQQENAEFEKAESEYLYAQTTRKWLDQKHVKEFASSSLGELSNQYDVLMTALGKYNVRRGADLRTSPKETPCISAETIACFLREPITPFERPCVSGLRCVSWKMSEGLKNNSPLIPINGCRVSDAENSSSDNYGTGRRTKASSKSKTRNWGSPDKPFVLREFLLPHQKCQMETDIDIGGSLKDVMAAYPQGFCILCTRQLIHRTAARVAAGVMDHPRISIQNHRNRFGSLGEYPLSSMLTFSNEFAGLTHNIKGFFIDDYAWGVSTYQYKDPFDSNAEVKKIKLNCWIETDILKTLQEHEEEKFSDPKKYSSISVSFPTFEDHARRWYDVLDGEDAAEKEAKSAVVNLLWTDDALTFVKRIFEVTSVLYGWGEEKILREEDYEFYFPYWSVDKTEIRVGNCKEYLALLMRVNFLMEAREVETQYLKMLPYIGLGSRRLGCFYDDNACANLKSSDSVSRRKYEVDFKITERAKFEKPCSLFSAYRKETEGDNENNREGNGRDREAGEKNEGEGGGDAGRASFKREFRDGSRNGRNGELGDYERDMQELNEARENLGRALDFAEEAKLMGETSETAEKRKRKGEEGTERDENGSIDTVRKRSAHAREAGNGKTEPVTFFCYKSFWKREDPSRSLVECSIRLVKINDELERTTPSREAFYVKARDHCKKELRRTGKEPKTVPCSIFEDNGSFVLSKPVIRRCEFDKPFTKITRKEGQWLLSLKRSLRIFEKIIFYKDFKLERRDSFFLGDFMDVYEFIKTYDKEGEEGRLSRSGLTLEGTFVEPCETDVFYSKRSASVESVFSDPDNVELLYFFGLGYGRIGKKSGAKKRRRRRLDDKGGENVFERGEETGRSEEPCVYDVRTMKKVNLFGSNKSLLISVIYVVGSCERDFKILRKKFPISLSHSSKVIELFGTSSSKSGAFPSFVDLHGDDENGEGTDPSFPKGFSIFEAVGDEAVNKKFRRKIRRVYDKEAPFVTGNRPLVQRAIETLYDEQFPNQRTKAFQSVVERYEFLLMSFRNAFLPSALYYDRCNFEVSKMPSFQEASSRRSDSDGFYVGKGLDRDDEVPMCALFPSLGTDSEGEESLLYGTQYALPKMTHLTSRIPYWSESTFGPGSAFEKAGDKVLPYRSRGRSFSTKIGHTGSSDPVVYSLFRLILYLAMTGGYCAQYSKPYELSKAMKKRFGKPKDDGITNRNSLRDGRFFNRTFRPSFYSCLLFVTEVFGVNEKSDQRKRDKIISEEEGADKTPSSSSSSSSTRRVHSFSSMLHGPRGKEGIKRELAFVGPQKHFCQQAWRQMLFRDMEKVPVLLVVQPFLDMGSARHSNDFAMNGYRQHAEQALKLVRLPVIIEKNANDTRERGNGGRGRGGGGGGKRKRGDARERCMGSEPDERMFTEEVHKAMDGSRCRDYVEKMLYWEQFLQKIRRMMQIYPFKKGTFPSEILESMKPFAEAVVRYELNLREMIKDLQKALDWLKKENSVAEGKGTEKSSGKKEDEGENEPDDDWYADGAPLVDNFKPKFDDETGAWIYKGKHESVSLTLSHRRQKVIKKTLERVVEETRDLRFPECCFFSSGGEKGLCGSSVRGKEGHLSDTEEGEGEAEVRLGKMDADLYDDVLDFLRDEETTVPWPMIEHYLRLRMDDLEILKYETSLEENTIKFLHDFSMKDHAALPHDPEEVRELLFFHLGKEGLETYTELRDLYPDKMKPGTLKGILEKTEVNVFLKLYYLFRMQKFAESIRLEPIEETVSDNVDRAMRFRRYGILEGKEELPDAAYDVYLAPCCGKIATGVTPGTFGQNYILYNSEMEKYVCGKKKKKEKRFIENYKVGGIGDEEDNEDDDKENEMGKKKIRSDAEKKGVEEEEDDDCATKGEERGKDPEIVLNARERRAAIKKRKEEEMMMVEETVANARGAETEDAMNLEALQGSTQNATLDDDDEDEVEEKEPVIEEKKTNPNEKNGRTKGRVGKDIFTYNMKGRKRLIYADMRSSEFEASSFKNGSAKEQKKIAKAEKKRSETTGCPVTPAWRLSLRNCYLIYNQKRNKKNKKLDKTCGHGGGQQRDGKGKTSAMFGHCPRCAQFHEIRIYSNSIGYSGYSCAHCEKTSPENYAVRKCSYCDCLISEKQYACSVRIPVFDVNMKSGKAIDRKAFCSQHSYKKMDHPGNFSKFAEPAPTTPRGGRRRSSANEKKKVKRIAYDTDILPTVFSDVHEALLKQKQSNQWKKEVVSFRWK